jgi:hypothetical protein
MTTRILKLPHSISNYSRYAEEYLSLALRFQNLLARNGISVSAFSDRGLEHFLSFPEHDQYRFTAQLRNYLAICEGGELEGIDIAKDSARMIRYTAKTLNFTLSEEFMDTITSQDILEIFSYEGVQLYRNFRFFEISDYTIDDFFGRHWEYLYERSESVSRQLAERLEAATKLKQCLPFAIDEHYMRERATANRKIVKVNLRYVAPLLRAGNPVAWIASSQAKIITNKTDAEAEKLIFMRSGS